MKSKMFKNNTEIIKFEKVGRNNFAYLETGEKVCSGKLGKMQIECSQCNSHSEIGFRSALLRKKYVCQSCIKLGGKNPFYGRTHTEDTKKQHSNFMKGRFVGENNAFYGKKHTEKTKEKLSRNRKGKYTGQNNPFYGKTHSEETIDIIREKNRLYRKNMSPQQRQKESLTLSKIQKNIYNDNPTLYSEKRRKAAYESHESQFQNCEMNNIEKRVYEKLLELGIGEHFKYSVILNYMQFDFGCKDKKILLEVHGDYWHGNPLLYSLDCQEGKKILNKTQQSKKLRDNEKYNFATDHGFKVYYIWEHDINNNNWAVLERIKNEF